MKTVIVLRKPLEGTVAQNCLEHGCGALNIDACRLGTADALSRQNSERDNRTYNKGSWKAGVFGTGDAAGGRWPSNVILHERVVAELDAQSGESHISGGFTEGSTGAFGKNGVYGAAHGEASKAMGYGDTGGASRFFKQVKK